MQSRTYEMGIKSYRRRISGRSNNSKNKFRGFETPASLKLTNNTIAQFCAVLTTSFSRGILFTPKERHVISKNQ